MSTITYSHCTHATPGKPDVAPHTFYVFRDVEYKMYRCPPEWMLGETEDTFQAESVVDGETITGYGETKDEAAGELRYKLMDHSRTAAGFNFNPQG